MSQLVAKPLLRSFGKKHVAAQEADITPALQENNNDSSNDDDNNKLIIIIIIIVIIVTMMNKMIDNKIKNNSDDK